MTFLWVEGLWQTLIQNDVELIASYRTLAPDLATALEAAQARIVELEAQAAVLRGHLENIMQVVDGDDDKDAECAWCGHVVGEGHHADEYHQCPVPEIRGVLANLPQAVQQHLERDRAAEDRLKDAEALIGKYASVQVLQDDEPPAHFYKMLLAEFLHDVVAYRAAGGEQGDVK